MSKVSVLPMDVEKSITTCKEQIFEREKLRESFPNTLLREDVLELLDRFCTVVYFPLKREENNVLPGVIVERYGLGFALAIVDTDREPVILNEMDKVSFSSCKVTGLYA